MPEGERRDSLLMLSEWPSREGLENAEADAEIGWIIKLVTEVRSVRAEMNVPAGAKVPFVIADASAETKARFATHDETIRRLARVETIDFGALPSGSVQIVLDEATVGLPLQGVIDFGAEQERLKREIDKVQSEIVQITTKLANEKFVSRAPTHVVEEQRERKDEAEATVAKLAQAIERLATL
jgi:valyl-tRNA synthetase